MMGWIWILSALVIAVAIATLATRGRRGARAMGHDHPIRNEARRRPRPTRPPIGANDSTDDLRKEPSMEYLGEVYFFCSIEARDTFTANLQRGEFDPGESAICPRAIQRRQ